MPSKRSFLTFLLFRACAGGEEGIRAAHFSSRRLCASTSAATFGPNAGCTSGHDGCGGGFRNGNDASEPLAAGGFKDTVGVAGYRAKNHSP
jgi:hypothetical protein